MRIVRVFICFLLLFCICFTFLYGNKKITESKSLSNVEEVKDIITLWHIDTFEGGTGSRKQFLSKISNEFEKKEQNVLMLVVEQTIESAIENLNNNIYPDIISYGNGVELENLIDLKIDTDFEGGKVYKTTLAIPWCRGGYCLIENPNFNGKTGGELCVISQAKYSVPLYNLLDYNYQIKVLPQFNAYLEFVNLKAKYLLGTQRDVVRLKNRNMPVKVTPLSYYNDLYQYVSIISKDEERSVISKKFIDFLLLEKTQKRLSEISMFSNNFSIDFQDETLNKMQNIKGFKTISVFNKKDIFTEIQTQSLSAYYKKEESINYLKKFII